MDRLPAPPTDLPFTVVTEPRWLLLSSPHPLHMLSWAVHGGGPVTAKRVAWHTVTDADLPLDVDPAEMFRARLAARGWEDAVGLLTSRAVDTFRMGSATVSGVRAVSVFTVDLGNAERIGAPGVSSQASFRPGTVNSFTWVSEPLSPNALVEALAMTVQARTLTLLDRAPGGWATGTGT
ncbi:MAG: adenosylcobinamide amidohydrolase, partial [Polaromonas sp.]